MPSFNGGKGLSSFTLRLLRCEEEPLWKTLVDGGVRAGRGKMNKWKVKDLAAMIEGDIKLEGRSMF